MSADHTALLRECREWFNHYYDLFDNDKLTSLIDRLDAALAADAQPHEPSEAMVEAGRCALSDALAVSVNTHTTVLRDVYGPVWLQALREAYRAMERARVAEGEREGGV